MTNVQSPNRAWVLVLLNKRAGTLMDMDADALVRDLSACLEESGARCEARLLNGAEINQAAREAVEAAEPPAALFVGGGDGTIIAAASALMGSTVPLGIIPLGTLNLLARDLLMPLDPEEALRAQLDGIVGGVDLARINGQPFLNLVMIGIKSSVTRIREKQRGRLSPWHWARLLWHAVKVFRRAPRSPLTLETDGGGREVRPHGLGVANNAFVNHPGMRLSRDRLNAGLLSVYVGRHQSLGALLSQIPRLLMGRAEGDAELDEFTAPRLTIRTRRPKLHLTIDGEPALLSTPLELTIEPGALRVLAPAEAADRLADPGPSPLAARPAPAREEARAEG